MNKIKINKQEYYKHLINKYPEIKSGRKNYNEQYERVLKNLLLVESYKKNIFNCKNIFLKKFFFYSNKYYLYLKLKK